MTKPTATPAPAPAPAEPDVVDDTTPQQQPAPEPEQPADTPPEDQPTEDTGADRKLRRRAQAAEAERDEAVAALDALRRQLVETESGLTAPSILWRLDVDPASFFGDDGRLDRDTLTAHVTDLAAQHGLATRPKIPRPDPSQGSAHGHIPTIADAFR